MKYKSPAVLKMKKFKDMTIMEIEKPIESGMARRLQE